MAGRESLAAGASAAGKRDQGVMTESGAAFGAELRSERERRGISLERLCAETKLNPRYLDALEQGNFKALPGGVFRRGVVRAYLSCVGLAEQIWMPRFDSSFAGEAVTSDASGNDDAWATFAVNVKRNRGRSTQEHADTLAGSAGNAGGGSGRRMGGVALHPARSSAALTDNGPRGIANLKVHLVNMRQSALDAMMELYRVAEPKLHELVEDPGEADIILFVGSWDIYGSQVIEHPLPARYPEKCFVYFDADGFVPLLRGNLYECREGPGVRLAPCGEPGVHLRAQP